ncbi:MAG TPA: tetratricopeptide repeat protein [Sphingomicrobium sp.]
MSKPSRFGSAVSTAALASLLASCATPHKLSSFGGQANENVGLATRAMLALNAKNIPQAIDFAERAVARNPQDAGFRALLGNAYFADGRFNSAEAAYKDSLSIYPSQPQVVLKLALVHIALGRNAEAVSLLRAGHVVLDASDYGLALALAGRPTEAIKVLGPAARQPGADSRVRQNLALAFALSGDWTEARTIAAQDVPANQLDARIQQWMQLAHPHKASDQVAALVGVTPATVDPGQPVRLALNKGETLVAEAAPAPAAKPRPQPKAQQRAAAAAPKAPAVVAQAAPPPAPAPQPAPAPAPRFVAVATPAPAPQPAPAPAPRFVAVATPAPAPQPHVAVAPPPPPAPPAAPQPKPVVAQAAAPAPAPLTVAMIAAASPEAPAAFAAFMPKPVAPAKPKPRRAAAPKPQPRRGNPNAVMQLGSYRSPQYVTAAWAQLTRRYPALRVYLPMRARFDSPKGTYWRLSVQGFANQREAIARCQLLKSHGGNCFVRGFAGDAPVQLAMR